jgi:hypothetical protein
MFYFIINYVYMKLASLISPNFSKHIKWHLRNTTDLGA